MIALILLFFFAAVLFSTVVLLAAVMTAGRARHQQFVPEEEAAADPRHPTTWEERPVRKLAEHRYLPGDSTRVSLVAPSLTHAFSSLATHRQATQPVNLHNRQQPPPAAS